MTRVRNHQYPKPGPTGGRLIREVIRNLRSAGVALPLTSDILIAASAGIDSTALAHLLAKYGRRVGDPKRIRLIHLNHGWRGKESDQDARFVTELAKRLKVRAATKKATELPKPGESPEDSARRQRKAFFAENAKKARGAIVFTAHHADDLAETALWRILTGGADTHGGGIALRHENEVRPFLTVRKRELRRYLEEEGETWREDRTNHEGRLLRSRMRLEIVPILETLFPKAVDHLAKLALDAQKRGDTTTGSPSAGELLLGAAGLAARRPHFERLREIGADWLGELHLPGGWKLRREKAKPLERWVLERVT